MFLNTIIHRTLAGEHCQSQINDVLLFVYHFLVDYTRTGVFCSGCLGYEGPCHSLPGCVPGLQLCFKTILKAGFPQKPSSMTTVLEKHRKPTAAPTAGSDSVHHFLLHPSVSLPSFFLFLFSFSHSLTLIIWVFNRNFILAFVIISY